MHHNESDKKRTERRISVGNMISLDYEMFRYSTTSLFENAGVPTENIDYVVVTWKAPDRLLEYLDRLKSFCHLHHLTYTEDSNIGYIPNIRAMINEALDCCFELNEYACLVNSDVYFGRNWLANLLKYIDENIIVSSMLLSPIRSNCVITADLGAVREGEFDEEQFLLLYRRLYANRLETEEERGSWRSALGFPYVFNKKWWELYGPWELELAEDRPRAPDVRFFQRCHEAGARFVMSRSSIVYHQEAGERRHFKRTKEFGHMRKE